MTEIEYTHADFVAARDALQNEHPNYIIVVAQAISLARREGVETERERAAVICERIAEECLNTALACDVDTTTLRNEGGYASVTKCSQTIRKEPI